MNAMFKLFTLALCFSPIISSAEEIAEDASTKLDEAASETAHHQEQKTAESFNNGPPIAAPIQQTGPNFSELIRSYNTLVGRLHHLLNTMNYEWRDLGISPIREYRMQQFQLDPPLNSIVTDIPLLGVANPANFNNDDLFEVFRSFRPTRTRNGFRFPGFGEIILEQPQLFPAASPLAAAFRNNNNFGMLPNWISGDIPELGLLNPFTMLFAGANQNSDSTTANQATPAHTTTESK